MLSDKKYGFTLKSIYCGQAVAQTKSLEFQVCQVQSWHGPLNNTEHMHVKPLRRNISVQLPIGSKYICESWMDDGGRSHFCEKYV